MTLKEIIKRQTQEAFWEVLQQDLTPTKLYEITDKKVLFLAENIYELDNESGLFSIIGVPLTKVDYFNWCKEVLSNLRGEPQ